MPVLTVVLYPFGELLLEALVHCLHSLGGCSVQEFPSLVPHLVCLEGVIGCGRSRHAHKHVAARDWMGGVRHAHYLKRRGGYNELQNGGG